MADPLAPPPASETQAYRPLSGFALAGFAVSTLFTLVVLANTLIALVQGIPFFFPEWFVLLAGVGLVLSLLGQQQIRNSEGTRAGLALASIPPIILFLIFQRQILRGITLTGLKG